MASQSSRPSEQGSVQVIITVLLNTSMAGECMRLALLSGSRLFSLSLSLSRTFTLVLPPSSVHSMYAPRRHDQHKLTIVCLFRVSKDWHILIPHCNIARRSLLTELISSEFGIVSLLLVIQLASYVRRRHCPTTYNNSDALRNISRLFLFLLYPSTEVFLESMH